MGILAIDAVDSLVNLLGTGGVVCFPTETVYALSVSISFRDSIDRLYKLKCRSPNKPLSLLVNSVDCVVDYAYVNEEQLSLIKKLSPGPVTFILKCKYEYFYSIFGERIGIRIPNHPIASSILKKFQGNVVATSANISGSTTPRYYDDIDLRIRGNLDGMIKEDSQVSGLPSTVIDIIDYPKFSLIREGAVLSSDIKQLFMSTVAGDT